MSRFTKEEKIKIGQETFYRLIETEYGNNVRNEIMAKYNISASQLSTFLSMFKNHIVEPKPTKEELLILDKFYQKKLVKNYSDNGSKKEYPIVKLLLTNLSDIELVNLTKKYNLTYIKSNIKDYLKEYPLDKDKLDLIVSKLELIYNQIKEDRKNERINLINEDRKDSIINILNEYLNSSDIYPNYIFNKYQMRFEKFNNWINISKLPGNEDLKELFNLYNQEIKLRENIFVNMINELINDISLDNLSVLDFYRKFKMPLSKFKFFTNIARRRNLINDDIVNIINKYTYKFTIGSYEYNSLEELKSKLNYNYNGVELTKEMLDDICLELNNENIPINRNTIVCLFQEKINNRVNKR